jgi:predicted RNA-binding Zn-ribbon protein involved in translation (DUF1610 family)
MKLLKAGEKTKPDGWYFFISCRSCGNDLIFAEAPSPEDEPKPRVRGVKSTCPHCGKAHSYRANEVRRGQAEDTA